LHFIKNYFYIQHPVKGKLLFEPYEYQVRLLDSYHNHRFNCNLLPRQSGKCVHETTNIRIKHKHTGQILEMSIGDFFKMQKLG
jgi:hypothetical protein